MQPTAFLVSVFYAWHAAPTHQHHRSCGTVAVRPPRPHVAPNASATPPPASPSPNAENSSSPRRRSSRLRRRRRKSALENTLDDLTMKRMGRGSIFYGTRQDDEADLPDESDDDDDDGLMRDNAVLVTGATGRTGQWIALGLQNQDFNVRVLTRSMDRSERIFGPSGANVDVVESDLSRDNDELPELLQGVTTVVIASGAAAWIPGALQSVDVRGVQRLLAAAKPAGVSRVVLISSATATSPRGKAKRDAEAIVRESGMAYTIVRAGALTEDEGGIKEITLTPQMGAEDVLGRIARLDLAQVVCQAIVHQRRIETMAAEDSESGVEFPSCIVTAVNGRADFEPDRRFWRREYNRISDTFLAPEDTLPEDDNSEDSASDVSAIEDTAN